MKFGVVIFPGSNCDQDIIYTLEKIMQQNVVPLWHKESDIQGVDMIVLPGGFSYGDYLRSGAIASLSPIMKEVITFAQNGGFVLGICNGFQILCESKLLPGTLLANNNQKFVCKNQYIRVENNHTILTNMVPQNKALNIPIAHAEGRFYANDDTLKSIIDNNQILFKYCDENSEIKMEANPNGSVENIAGITNKQKNVFGMMPHPERAADKTLDNTDGISLFESLITSIKTII